MNTNTLLSKGSWIRLNQRQAARAGIFSLLLLLTLPAVMQAQFTYTTNNGVITITGYTGPGGDVTIPDMINGLPVTSIGVRAFLGPFVLTNVTIPNGVTSIGDSAFSYCTGLASVTIGNGVIGDFAFDGCNGLTSITLGDGVSSLGIAAFYLCGSLSSVTIPNSVTNIGSWVFSGCYGLTNASIGASVTSIGRGAFNACTNLTAITVDVLNPAYSSLDGVLFDKSQTTLSEYAAGKTGTSYAIPNSITNVAEGAFGNCARLTSVMIPNSVTSLGDFAFENCTSLSTVMIPNSVTSIGTWAFDGCISLTNVTIGKAVTSIANQMFQGCTNLTNITIPDSVATVGVEAFSLCSSLKNVTIGNGLTSIGYHAFNGCRSLTSLTLPNSVTSIAYEAFAWCISLTSITIGNSVTSIGDSAFFGCGSLTSVYFQGNAPSLGSDVFDYWDLGYQVWDPATIYYLPGTTGWASTFGGRPTALWIQVPTIQTPPQTQTAETTSAVGLWVDASSPLPLFYFWYLNATNLLSSGSNWQLELTNVQFAQSGAYTVVISNVLGAVTSAPALLNVVAAVERRPVPGVKVTGQTGSLVNVDYADSLSPAPNWTPLGSVILTSTPQYCVDLTLRLPPQRFYRAWQTGTPGVRPSLDLLPVPAITLTGTIGHSVRLDYINQFGPIDAWVTLATVPLTNTSQLYFDISAPGQPPRLYRLVPSP
jgi:hypothetical protein